MATETINIPVEEEVARAFAASGAQTLRDVQQLIASFLTPGHVSFLTLGHPMQTPLSVQSPSPASNRALYDTDTYAWSQTTAALIRANAWQGIDLEALAEEVESLGRSEKREIEHRLEVLVMHLLKWCYQSDYQKHSHSHSWYDTIREQRSQLARLLRDNPSLRPQVPTFLTESYPEARQRASGETHLGMERFPQGCPWTPEQVLDRDFWPEE